MNAENLIKWKVKKVSDFSKKKATASETAASAAQTAMEVANELLHLNEVNKYEKRWGKNFLKKHPQLMTGPRSQSGVPFKAGANLVKVATWVAPAAVAKAVAVTAAAPFLAPIGAAVLLGGAAYGVKKLADHLEEK